MADDITGMTEIDVIFPRNDTFAPMGILPVVFAVRNPQVARLLHPDLRYTIYSIDEPGSEIFYHAMDRVDLNLPSNDSTYLWYEGNVGRFLTEGRWVFQWGWQADNCSKTDDPKFQDEPFTPWPSEKVYRGFHLKTKTLVPYFIFTIAKNGTVADLSTLTGPDRCADADALAFSIEAQMDIPQEMDAGYRTKCGRFPDGPTPIPSPCQVTVNAETVSSISSAITSTECKRLAPRITSCPPEDEDSAGSCLAARHALGFAVLCGWLLHAMVLI